MSRNIRGSRFLPELPLGTAFWGLANAALFWVAALGSASCTSFGEISLANNGGGGASAANGGGGGTDPANDPCTPGAERSCYSGAAETAYVGLCVPGKRICKLDGLGFGDCEGEVLPATETCGNPADEDCDGLANEDGADCNCTPGTPIDCYSAAPVTKDVGPCKAGSQTCNEEGNGYTACDGEITPKAETCDTSFDDDCDGSVNEEGDSCVCVPGTTEDCSDAPSGKAGVGACVMGSRSCNSAGTEWGSCDGDVSPTSSETCNNGKDDDCNGQTDDGCTCTPGNTQSCYSGTDETKGVGSCKAGSQTCASDGTWGACSGEILPTSENCTTSADDDCDGTANESAAGCVCTPGATESCYTGPSGTKNVGLCAGGTRTCASTGKSWGPCQGQTLPAVAELCDNGEDDNCAGGVDEGCDDPCVNGWAIVLVDEGGFPSIALDSAGAIHIAYADYSGTGPIHYARKNGANWDIEYIGDVGYNRHPSLAVDGTGGLHLAYYDESNDELTYAFKPTAGTWDVELLGDLGNHPSIAVDASGGIHIASFDVFGGGLKYSYKPTDGGWFVATVDNNTSSLRADPSLAVNSAGDVHISYSDDDTSELKYAHKPSGGAWSVVVVDTTGTIPLSAVVGATSSLATDISGGVHIGYYDTESGSLMYAGKPNLGSWSTEDIASVGDPTLSSDTSLKVDASGGIHVTYNTSSMKYAFKPTGGAWSSSTIDQGGPKASSLALDSSGSVHVAYAMRPGASSEIRYAAQCP